MRVPAARAVAAPPRRLLGGKRLRSFALVPLLWLAWRHDSSLSARPFQKCRARHHCWAGGRNSAGAGTRQGDRPSLMATPFTFEIHERFAVRYSNKAPDITMILCVVSMPMM